MNQNRFFKKNRNSILFEFEEFESIRLFESIKKLESFSIDAPNMSVAELKKNIRQNLYNQLKILAKYKDEYLRKKEHDKSSIDDPLRY